MARIVYSMAQEGRGHASRACEIIRRLISKGHHVTVLTGGDSIAPLEEAFSKNPKFSLVKIPGFRLAYDDFGRVDYVETISFNATNFLKSNRTISKIERLMMKQKFDLAISDFEPYLPRAAKKVGCRFITLDNQHRMVFEKADKSFTRGKHALSYFVTKTIIREMHPLGPYCIISSSFRPVIDPSTLSDETKVVTVGPIIRKEVEALKRKVKKEDFVLVYVKRPLEGAIIPKIKDLPGRFIMYVKNPAEHKSSGKSSITYRRHSAVNFASDLARCKAVVSSAGEQLMSEALYLGKPLFSIPEEGTFEQTLNAWLVKKNKVGTCEDISKLNPGSIEAFLKKLPEYEKNIKKQKVENGIEDALVIINKALGAL
jgi:uncharacterized protein (TIGR00661 family)